MLLGKLHQFKYSHFQHIYKITNLVCINMQMWHPEALNISMLSIEHFINCKHIEVINTLHGPFHIIHITVTALWQLTGDGCSRSKQWNRFSGYFLKTFQIPEKKERGGQTWELCLMVPQHPHCEAKDWGIYNVFLIVGACDYSHVWRKAWINVFIKMSTIFKINV